MNQARRQLAMVPPPEQIAALEREIRNAIESIEQGCQVRGLSPRDLPGPSRRAYEYLRSLEFRSAVVEHPDAQLAESLAGNPRRAPRLIGWIRHKDAVQRRLAMLAREQIRSPGAAPQKKIADLRAEILAAAAQVADWCERAGSSPAALPAPARRAYQWMSYLAKAGHLERHIEALAASLAIDPAVEVEFYHLSALYRVTRQAEQAHLVASEAFVGAPASVLRALVRVTLPRTRKARDRARIEHYAESAAFQQAILELESVGVDPHEARGLVHNLQEVFDRVNACYFDGGMARPRLRWSRTVSEGEFGHYQQSTDTVVLSVRLDSADVPDFVVDHVMHHELLHKRLGSARVGGRRRCHTEEFRRAERRFAAFEEADRFLRELTSGRARRGRRRGCGRAE